MLEMRARPLNRPALPCLALPSLPNQLWSLVYRSRPSAGLDGPAVARMLHRARKENRAAGISGVLVMGENEIIQWLEGPELAVRQLLAKIIADPRHHSVSVMESFPVQKRLFGNWSMLLAGEEVPEAAELHRGIYLPANNIADLGADKNAIRDKFSQLAQAARDQALAECLPIDADSSASEQAAAAALEQLVDNLLNSPFLPAVAERASGNAREQSLLTTVLTRTALAHDIAKLVTVLQHGSSRASDPLAAQILMLEQTERRLGDLWEIDACSETDISLAIQEMVSAIRTIHLGAIPRLMSMPRAPVVLVISEPGEFHFLPAVLDAEVLYQRGWQPQLDFPESDAALAERMGDFWYEAVDISLSDVFRRDHWVQRLSDTVATIRKHSRNPHVAITVSGRVFRSEQGLLERTGADRLVLSASEIEWSITEALKTQGAPMQ